MDDDTVINIENMNGLCRACLTRNSKMVSLNDYYDDTKKNTFKIWQVLNIALNLKISLDDQFPCNLCSTCLKLLKVVYEFKLVFKKSQETLSELFNEELVESDNYSLKTVSENSEVQLISKQGKFDLKDVFIVEQDEEEFSDFEGFLNNLGTEVSASFVNNKPLVNVKESVPFVDKENEVNIKEKVNVLREDPTDVMCFTCETKFSNKTQLKMHVNEKHSHKKEIYVCEVCGIALKSRSSYYHHMLKHSGKKHLCDLCQKSYSNSSALQLHVAAVHKNTRTHLCTICGKQFNYGNALSCHMRIHTDERKYKCTYCDKTFRIQCGLDRHLRTHTGIRPYKCSYCAKAFRSKGELDCHEMTHTGYRPYHCQYCKKGFTKTYNLKLHLLSHKGQHSCTKCNRTFIELKFLNIHMLSSHSNDLTVAEEDV